MKELRYKTSYLSSKTLYIVLYWIKNTNILLLYYSLHNINLLFCKVYLSLFLGIFKKNLPKKHNPTKSYKSVSKIKGWPMVNAYVKIKEIYNIIVLDPVNTITDSAT